MGTMQTKQIIARVLISIAFAINVMCAIQFLVWPDTYVPLYSLTGDGARAAIQGFGVCFLMWNATYPPVIAHPHRYRVLFGVVIAQQLIGLVGESIILLGVDPATALFSSVLRFIVFDAGNLVLLIIAFMLTRQKETQANSKAQSSRRPS